MPKEIEEPDVYNTGDAALPFFLRFPGIVLAISVPSQDCTPNPLLCTDTAAYAHTHVCVKPALQSSCGVFVLHKVCVLGGVFEGHVHMYCEVNRFVVCAMCVMDMQCVCCT